MTERTRTIQPCHITWQGIATEARLNRRSRDSFHPRMNHEAQSIRFDPVPHHQRQVPRVTDSESVV